MSDQVFDLETALAVVLDCVDYVHGNCEATEMVGAVLPREVAKMARASLQMYRWHHARQQPRKPKTIKDIKIRTGKVR
jgi:hypothetical protein